MARSMAGSASSASTLDTDALAVDFHTPAQPVVFTLTLRRAAGSSTMRLTQRGGRNPARVTATSRRTAALDGRLLAAVRAWTQ